MRSTRILIQLLLDFFVSFVSLVVILRFFLSSISTLNSVIFAVILASMTLLSFYFLGSYRQLWRYTSFREIQNVALTCIIVSSVFLLFVTFTRSTLPISAVLTYSALLFLGCSSLRAFRRLFNRYLNIKAVSSNPPDNAVRQTVKMRTLILGAGTSAHVLTQEIISRSSNIELIGFLDDDIKKQGAEIHKIPVIGTLKDFETVILSHKVKNVVIAIPSGSQELIYRLVKTARQFSLSVKVVPPMYRLADANDLGNSYQVKLDELLDGKEFQGSDLQDKPKTNDKKVVLVTGGAGYIGLHLIPMLLETGYKVRILDNFVYGDHGFEVYKTHPDVECIHGDISDIRAVVRSVKGVETVIALAAIVGDPACGINAEETLNLNYESTKILVETANFYNVKRFVFASSCSVYGCSDDDLLTETSPLNPVSLYAKTRILSEEVIYERCGQMEPVILRLSTVFGLSPRMRFDLVVNTLTVRAIVNKKFQVFGGEQWRPFVHCNDVAQAFFLAATQPSSVVKGQVYNVGSTDMNYTLSQVGDIVKKLLPNAEYEQSKFEDDPRNYRVSFDKISKELGFKAKYSLESGIQEMIKAIKEDSDLQQFQSAIYSNYLTLKEKSEVEATH